MQAGISHFASQDASVPQDEPMVFDPFSAACDATQLRGMH